MQYSVKQYDAEKHDIFKALSVKQPYAGYIASGEKTIEVRSRPNKYRGKLLICASKDGMSKTGDSNRYGCTIAFVQMYDCKPLSELTDEEWKRTKLPSYIIQQLKEKGKGFGVEAILKTVIGTITCVNTCETIQPFLEKV